MPLLARLCLIASLSFACVPARASVGDPQVKTDHPWYPGELSCSTFERLFATQAALYERATGRKVTTDEDRALASWYWRNLNYWHGEEGKCDLFGQGFQKTDWNREYWGGLFAYGFSLCGTTHAQWNAEMNALLGHCRSRSVGVVGHNSFEVYLTGGAYGAGRWALLDHDISTVMFAPDGGRLLSIPEVQAQIKTLANPRFKPERQRGWRVAGLHDDDAAGVYTQYNVAEYLAGYAGPPPVVQLRPGESVRRYVRPGLDDGKSFVFWGMNYKTAGVPGPERSRTWVNQPEKMHGATKGTGHKDGQARFANAVYTYRPNFADGGYRAGAVAEDDQQVTLEFRTPYVIAATPANDAKWGIYEKGARNGLVVSVAKGAVAVRVSIDGGRTWSDEATASTDQPADLTDVVKGHNQYLLKLPAAATLKDAGLAVRTVCQTNVATIPHLHDGTNKVTFESSGLGLISAGPTQPQAEAKVVEGKIGSPAVTLELAPPRGEQAVKVYAASWQSSGAPPTPVKYQIEYSLDRGQTWQPVVKDWQITRRQPEPPDFWSQSFAWGEIALPETAGPVRVRFRNDGRKPYRKVEAHLAYRVPNPSPTHVTFGWTDVSGQRRTASHTYAATPGKPDASWSFDAGAKVETQWVEYSVK
jgi:hypothetical protein